jgi:hypothetical protein
MAAKPPPKANRKPDLSPCGKVVNPDAPPAKQYTCMRPKNHHGNCV